jgi:hypothetical protein
VYARLIFSHDLHGTGMSELELLPGNMVECAWCKDSKPVSETTWFMPEPGEKSVRLCGFCYEEARKQVLLIRHVKRRGEFPVEAAS